MQYASEALKNDPEFMIRAIRIDHNAMLSASAELSSNSEVVNELGRKLGVWKT